MEEKSQFIKLVDMTSNPAPVGLLGFGMTTVLLNLHNAGLIGFSSMILGMGIFYGGIAQFVAGMMEWKKNNTFGTAAFMSYGAFWLSLVALVVMPKMGLADAPDKGSMVAYLSLWGIFTFCMFIGTLKLNKTLQVIFLTLTILFFLLAASEYTGSATIKHIAGWEGIFCGFSAIYGAIAQVLNDVYKKTVLPL